MLLNTWSILCESAPFILVGFFVAGVLHRWLSGSRAVQFLSEGRSRSVFWATLIGVPLPLCSCSVLPTAITLRKKGASKGATVAFLISTPETSVTSILLTYALMGPIIAVFRPIAACLTAVTAGLLELRQPEDHAGVEGGGSGGASNASACCVKSASATSEAEQAGPSRRAPLRDAMRYAFVDLFDDIFWWIMVGIVAAAAIQLWFDPETIRQYLGGQVQSFLVMALLGVPMYVCAEASTPIAAALVAQGLNPGAALVFLLVGPATNMGSLGLLRRILGTRSVMVYLGVIILVAMAMGMILNAVFTGLEIAPHASALCAPLLPGWAKTAGAVVFLALGAGSVLRSRPVRGAWTKFGARVSPGRQDKRNSRIPHHP